MTAPEARRVPGDDESLADWLAATRAGETAFDVYWSGVAEAAHVWFGAPRAGQRAPIMTGDLERRIARVLVGSQHPGLPPGKVDELVTLGVGRATAALTEGEIQTWERGRSPMSCADIHGQRVCLRSPGHPGFHSQDDPPANGSFVWTSSGFTGEVVGPHRPPGGAERLGPIRHEPARPEPVTPAEVARLVEVLDAVAPPEVRLEDLPEPDLSGSIEKLVSSDDGPDWALIKPWVRKHWWRR